MSSQSSSVIDNNLVEEILDGSVQSFSLLIDRYKSFVFNIALKIVSNRELAEEITQDVFLKVYRNLDKFEFKSKFSTWLYRISYTTAVTANKKKSKLFFMENLEQLNSNEICFQDNSSSYANNTELDFDFRKALSKLADIDNLIITLYYLNEQSIDDICIILNLKRSAVKTRLHRARQRLKKLLM